jgi:hypothetical protein
VGDEMFMKESDLVDGKCPNHPNMDLAEIEEEKKKRRQATIDAIRKEYENPNNWQIYSEWVQQYFRLTEALAWVTNNKEIIKDF